MLLQLLYFALREASNGRRMLGIHDDARDPVRSPVVTPSCMLHIGETGTAVFALAIYAPAAFATVILGPPWREPHRVAAAAERYVAWLIHCWMRVWREAQKQKCYEA